jgi:hypothetical protein
MANRKMSQLLEILPKEESQKTIIISPISAITFLRGDIELAKESFVTVLHF